MALTMSPVLNPFTFLSPLADVRGKPYLSGRHICLDPCPVAVMSKGTMFFTISISGVLLPTLAASSQWVFCKSLVVLLHLVKPPDPHSIGNPVALSRSKSVHRVLFTAAASFNGCFDCDWIRFNTS